MTARLTPLLVLLALGSPAAAQPVTLAETPKPGDCSRYVVELNVSGHLVVTQEGKQQQLKLDATNLRQPHLFSIFCSSKITCLGKTLSHHHHPRLHLHDQKI